MNPFALVVGEFIFTKVGTDGPLTNQEPIPTVGVLAPNVVAAAYTNILIGSSNRCGGASSAVIVT